MSRFPLKSCERSQDTYSIDKIALVVQFIHFFLPLCNCKKWVLCPVWFCIFLCFKYLSVLGIGDLFWCCGICDCLLICIAFKGFCILLSLLPFLNEVHIALTHWCLDKLKTIADFKGFFRNTQTSYRVIFCNRIQNTCDFNHFFPLYPYLV